MNLFDALIDKTKNWLPNDGTVQYFGKVFSGQEANFYYQNLLETIAQKTYSDCRDFFESIGTKVALIGGNSDLHPCYKKYLEPEFVVESWSSDILGQEPEQFDINDPELEFKFIDNELRLQNLKSNSILFPDTSHPGAIAHARLVKRILECVIKENSPKN